MGRHYKNQGKNLSEKETSSPWPTGKPNISYSEVKCWTECGYRHKLGYIDKIVLEGDWIHADFGKFMHSGVEGYLKTRVMDIPSVLKEIEASWIDKARPDVEKWKSWATVCLTEFPEWLESQFPEWELLGAELALYEDIPNEIIKFKGFVDSLIKVPINKKTDRWKIWIIDWKTGPAYGWRKDKLEDPLVTSQLSLYKEYILRKFELLSKDVGCSFVVLKKGAKLGKSIGRYDISAGPKAMEASAKMVTNMIKGVRRGKFIKNKYACEWCDYAKSGHCIR